MPRYDDDSRDDVPARPPTGLTPTRLMLAAALCGLVLALVGGAFWLTFRQRAESQRAMEVREAADQLERDRQAGVRNVGAGMMDRPPEEVAPLVAPNVFASNGEEWNFISEKWKPAVIVELKKLLKDPTVTAGRKQVEKIVADWDRDHPAK